MLPMIFPSTASDCYLHRFLGAMGSCPQLFRRFPWLFRSQLAPIRRHCTGNSPSLGHKATGISFPPIWINLQQHPEYVDCLRHCPCGLTTDHVRNLHVLSDRKQMARESAGSWLCAEPTEDPEEEHAGGQVYKDLKKYVEKKYPNKPEWADLVEQYNPTSSFEEPALVDFRPQDRETPPADRVTIALETEEKGRVTRKTKWMIKQLRSPAVNDIPSMLEQWVKTMYPKRSDWLDLIKEFEGGTDRDLVFQILEFALFEDTFEVRAQDVTKLLIKYINLDRYDDVERVMESLDSRGFPPDFVVCTVLLDMYCKLKRLDKAREMFDRIRSLGFVPDKVACSALIDFYCKSGNPEAGEMLLSEIEEEKVHCTIDTYLSVLRGYGARGQLSEATRIFEIIKDDQFLRVRISSKAYSALMDAYTHADKLSSAVLTLEDMVAAGFVPEDESVALLIAAYEKKNHFHKAVDVLLKLESKAIRPGVETLTTLISWFGRLGLVDEAETMFEEIQRRGEKPECKTYVNLYTTYARAGLLEKARNILESLQEKKVILTDWAFEQMIQSLLDGPQLQEAKFMRDQMLSLGFTPSDGIERALLGIQTESFYSVTPNGNEPSQDRSL